MILEASSGAFWWADQIEERGDACYVLDPKKFRIIKDSWKKTDKYDARNVVKALWVPLVTGEFGIPCVYKPSAILQELRKLFSQYELLNRQIRILKNNTQAVLAENGIVVSSKGEPLQREVRRLITIKGITPLTALAFLADVGDVSRFKSLRRMNAYLGLVPRVKESGGKSRSGHISRESRKLTRTILSQSIYHVSNSSPYLRKFYCEVTDKRGCGRARITLIRKVCSIMRRMLLTGEEFRWIEHRLFEKKLREYEKVLDEMREERKSACCKS